MDQRKQLELQDEQTAQKRYREQVQARARRPVAYTAPANAIFTQDARPKLGAIPEGHLIGRIALIQPDAMLGGRTDFYIGEQHLSLDGIEVFSWAAPVACTYFRGRNHHEWCGDVAVVRSFVHLAGQISDLADDVLRDDAPHQPFRKRGLVIPARERAERPTPTARRAPVPAPPATQPVQPAPPVRDGSDPLAAPAPPPPAPVQPPVPARSEVRAEALLRARLAAPRAAALTPVLSTLQPDQYDLVTIPAMESVIVEGQPGTGKTIVASHRAAWMVNEEMAAQTPENALDGDVLLVGPTDGYAAHVRGVVSRLTAGSPRVFVTSMPSLMDQIVGNKTELKGPPSRSWMDVDVVLGQFARLAIRRLRDLKGVTPTVQAAYEFMRSNGGGGTTRVARDPGWVKYLHELPSYDRAVTFRAHAPLLALLRWEVAPPDFLRNVEHVLVDEAQDVTPLEWFLLTSINQAHAWTLLGDLNQRRSDHTLSSWGQVGEILALPYGAPEVRRLERGYRSTKPILEFANRLLARPERNLLAFQAEGPPPTVTKVRQGEIPSAVMTEISRLAAAYPQGTLAVIDVDPRRIRLALRTDGWQAVRGNQRMWEKHERQVNVLHPDSARGLEFDAVVVVEPHAFPKNVGRHGPLYTALTRPNRELSVVHSEPLPEALRGRQR